MKVERNVTNDYMFVPNEGNMCTLNIVVVGLDISDLNNCLLSLPLVTNHLRLCQEDDDGSLNYNMYLI